MIAVLGYVVSCTTYPRTAPPWRGGPPGTRADRLPGAYPAGDEDRGI